MHAEQFKEEIIRPCLSAMDAYTDAAVNLLLGTCAQESRMGHYIKQAPGPALGIFQMEPRTYDDIMDNYLKRKHSLKHRIFQFCHWDRADNPPAEMLVYHLRFATCFARVHYLRVPEALPEPEDIHGLARYWKKYYNTFRGKGSEEEFIENYKKLIGPLEP